MRKVQFSILLFIAMIASPVFGASYIFYVDQGAAESGSEWDGTDGHSYTGTPGAGYGYATVQAAITAMSSSNRYKIYLRGGTHDCHNDSRSNASGGVIIPYTLDGDSWVEGHYNYIGSYPGEWAVLDGESNCGYNNYVIGYYPAGADTTDTTDCKYWMFERLEIKNGKTGTGSRADMAAGIMWQGGPIKVRYCYIHDNQSTNGSENPGGLRVYHMQDSTVEYNYFKDNGVASPSSSDTNPGHIVIFSDYIKATTAVSGWTESDYPPTKGNTVRYNYISGGSVGIKHKDAQFLTGRCTTPSAANWDDTRDEWGGQDSP